MYDLVSAQDCSSCQNVYKNHTKKTKTKILTQLQQCYWTSLEAMLKELAHIM